MKILTVLFGLVSLPLVAADDLVGEYAAQAPEIATGMVLRADQSFEYYFAYGAADYMARGSWRRDKDSVFLTSSVSDAKPFRLVRTARSASNIARIYVLAPGGWGVQNMDVTLTTSAGELTGRTSKEGVAEFELKGSPKSVSIHVPVYDVDAGPFEIPPGNNDVWLEINGDAITHVKFRDERLKVVDGSLEMTFWKGEKPLLYKKQ